MPIDPQDVAKLPRGIRKSYERSPERFERTAKRYLLRSGLLAANNADCLRPVHKSSGIGGGTYGGVSANAITPRPAPTYGAGSEMKKLLRELDVPSAWCESCSQKAATMDANGVQWCRDNREIIVEWLREAEQNFARDAAKQNGREPTPQEIVKARNAQRWRTGWAAAKRFVWINPLDPFGSFVDEAIRRAEACR